MIRSGLIFHMDDPILNAKMLIFMIFADILKSKKLEILIYYIVLCCAVLCCAVLCCAVLCCFSLSQQPL